MTANLYDVVIVGASAAGLSVAVSSQRVGLSRIRILEQSSGVAFPELVGEHQLDVGFGEVPTQIDIVEDEGVEVVAVTTQRHQYLTRSCVVAVRGELTNWEPPINAPLGGRVLVDALPQNAPDDDVLVIGHTDHAVELASALADAGAGVVLAAGGMDPTRLSPAGENWLRRLERERRATVLYRSRPDEIGLVDGYPMAFFNDRRTPDLQFDYVVFASPRAISSPDAFGVTPAALASGAVLFVGEPDEASGIPAAPGFSIGAELAARVFPELAIPTSTSTSHVRRRFTSVIEDLRTEHYNATITAFEPTHSDLWVLRVKPDRGGISHLPGQYASLGLGYWEERVDDAEDAGLDDKWDKLVRRSYSISCPIFDDHGYLVSPGESEDLEFYIVLVPPTPGNVPGLTPRLALKRPGDRIYLGPKVAGRYTLAPVTRPTDTVLFFSTGTGEAPHNAMVVELLRKGHRGPIISAVSVRQWADLGYLDKHRALEQHWPQYHYLPMPTREADVPKRYIQDLIQSGELESSHGIALDPDCTHVFLCGNPSMIGLPEAGPDGETFPAVTGVVELLAQRGFTLDHRNQRGNIHFEEYW